MVVEFLHLKVLFQNYLKESREVGKKGERRRGGERGGEK